MKWPIVRGMLYYDYTKDFDNTTVLLHCAISVGGERVVSVRLPLAIA